MMTEKNNLGKREYLWALGLMSGTSLDGVDAALIYTDGIHIKEWGPTHFLPYPDEFQNILKRYLGQQSAPCSLIDELTQYHCKAVDALLKKFNKPVDIIGFHGQTLFHQPRLNGKNAITVQIGNPHLLLKNFNIPVVFNFRQNDIKHGGEGAPLVPIFHKALFEDVLKPVAIVNIGGVSNITILKDDEIIAGDVGPGNALINDWINLKTGKNFDNNGNYAALGKPHGNILNQWLSHPFFKMPLPKSLDRNMFSHFFNDIKDLSLEDGACTLTHFTVNSIKYHCAPYTSSLIIAGGGRHNTFMMSLLKNYFDVKLCEDVNHFDGDFIEAQAFAFLAVRSFYKYDLTYPSTTGVKYPVTGGDIYL